MVAAGLDAVGHDELGLFAEHLAEAEPEIHRHADHQRHVGPAQCLRPGPRKRHRVVGGHHTAGHPVHQHRDLPFLGKPQQRRLGVSPPDVCARHDHRPPRRGQQTRGTLQGPGIRARGRWHGGQCAGPAVIFRRRKGMVHRDVDESHTRRGTDRRPQRLVDQPAGVPGRLRGGRESGQWGHERHVVDLLQRAHAPAQRGGAAAQHHQGRLVLLGRRHRAHPVGHARPGGERGHARQPGHFRPALGGEGRGLLVPGVDQPDTLVTASVVDGKQVAARQREDGVDTAGFEPACDEPAGVYGLAGWSVDAHPGSLSIAPRVRSRGSIHQEAPRMPR